MKEQTISILNEFLDIYKLELQNLSESLSDPDYKNIKNVLNQERIKRNIKIKEIKECLIFIKELK